ncbi:hypothetical protein J6590_030785 [Homalodisca vitripennis]|nr:hypothetical protein J6590_030785 [Homalodisca vitripennis]
MRSPYPRLTVHRPRDPAAARIAGTYAARTFSLSRRANPIYIFSYSLFSLFKDCTLSPGYSEFSQVHWRLRQTIPIRPAGFAILASVCTANERL